uniref:Uncharacterized protein n=1 Tax=Leersia perrieri TaxID=77586 RepID=A0A0D9VI55_9ORYZ
MGGSAKSRPWKGRELGLWGGSKEESRVSNPRLLLPVGCGGCWKFGRSGSIDRRGGGRNPSSEEEEDDAGEAEDRRPAAERGEEPEGEGVPARGPRRRPQGHLSRLQGSTG